MATIAPTLHPQHQLSGLKTRRRKDGDVCPGLDSPKAGPETRTQMERIHFDVIPRNTQKHRILKSEKEIWGGATNQ